MQEGWIRMARYNITMSLSQGGTENFEVYMTQKQRREFVIAVKYQTMIPVDIRRIRNSEREFIDDGIIPSLKHS